MRGWSCATCALPHALRGPPAKPRPGRRPSPPATRVSSGLLRILSCARNCATSSLSPELHLRLFVTCRRFEQQRRLVSRCLKTLYLQGAGLRKADEALAFFPGLSRLLRVRLWCVTWRSVFREATSAASGPVNHSSCYLASACDTFHSSLAALLGDMAILILRRQSNKILQIRRWCRGPGERLPFLCLQGLSLGLDTPRQEGRIFTPAVPSRGRLRGGQAEGRPRA